MKTKGLILSLLALFSFCTAVQAQNSLTHVRIETVPDNYGPETPDIFFILKDGNNVIYTSPVTEADPPIFWNFNQVLDSTKTYTIEVWDDDAPFTANDDLGTVTIAGTGSGTVFGTVGGAAGQLELYYEYTVITSAETGFSAIEELRVFPNPSEGNFVLEMDVIEQRQCHLSVTDMAGKNVLTRTLLLEPGTAREELNLRELAAGNYVLTLVSGRNMLSRVLEVLD